MSRKLTTKLGLGTWSKGEKPGAGPQTFKGGTGLNYNWWQLDDAVGTEHNADGSHKDAVIQKNNLHTNVADGTTIELDATQGLRVKAGGIGANEIGDGEVGNAELATDAVTQDKMSDNSVGEAEIINGSVTLNKIPDNTITTAKLVAGIKQLGMTVLYDSHQEAGLAAGNAAAAIPEWTETSAAPVIKITGRIYIPKAIASANKIKIRLRGAAKNTSTKGWTVTFNAGGSSISANGVNTSYDGSNPEIDLAIELSDGVSVVGQDVYATWSVSLQVTLTVTTAYLTNAVVALVSE